MRKKEWFYKAAACIASAALTLTALPVISASAATSVKGTSHVTQFGEYNIEVTVGVEDQKIRSLSVEGKNYAGNYVSDNKMRLEMAARYWKMPILANPQQMQKRSVPWMLFPGQDILRKRSGMPF